MGSAFGSVDPFGETAQESQELAGLRFVDVTAEFRPRERCLQLCEQAFRHDELEFTLEPRAQQTRRRSGTGEQRGDQDIDVEQGPH